MDEKKAMHYYERGAMGGDIYSRHNLGVEEEKKGNLERAVKHCMIAAKDGNGYSLTMIKELYSDGQATREDYTKALLSYQAYLGEIKSDQRDKAAAAHEHYRYYV